MTVVLVVAHGTGGVFDNYGLMALPFVTDALKKDSPLVINVIFDNMTPDYRQLPQAFMGGNARVSVC